MQPAPVLGVLVHARGVRATNAQLASTQAQLVKTAAAANQMGAQIKKAAKVTAVAAAGVAAASVKLAVDFDKSMRNVNSIAQLPERQFRNLEKRVLKLAGPTAQAPRTLAEGLYDLVSSGFDADESMSILAKSARAATAGLTTTEVSTKAVAAVLNAYKRPAADAGKVSDALFRTVDRGVITFETLADNIGDVLPFASALGVGLKDVGAATASMTKAGVSGPETMTRIKGAMVALLKPSEDMSKVLDRLGVQTGEELIRKTGSFQGALQALSVATGGSKEKMAELFPDIRGLGGALLLTGKNAKGAAMDLAGLRDSSGATSRALSQQSKSVALQWQRLKAQASVLGIEFGQKLLPQISKVLRVLSDPKLSGEQKFDRISNMLGEAIRAAIPKAADAAAQAAPKVAKGFVEGWLAAGVCGRLIIGGFLLSKLGGLGAFRRLGATSGTAMGAGMATGVATSGLKGRLVGMLRGWGPLMAVGAAATLGPELVKKVQEGIRRDTPEFRAKVAFEGATKGARSLDELTSKVRGAREEVTQLRRQGERFAAPMQMLEARARDTGQAFDKLSEPVRTVQRVIRRMSEGSSESISSLRTNVRLGTKAIKQNLSQDTKAGKDALVQHFQAAAQNARRSMGEAGKVTKEGTRFIEEMMTRALQNMGFSKKQALRVKGGRDPVRNTEIGGPGHKQRGGPIDMGRSSGDSVPAMLERGEYVLNRRAVAKVGQRKLDQINFAAAPRFATGGYVQGAQQPSGPSSGPIRAFAQQMFARGFNATSAGEYRGSGTYHDQQMAIDWGDSANDLRKMAGVLMPRRGGFAELFGPAAYMGLFKRGSKFSDSALQAQHEDHIHTALVNALKGALGKAGAAFGATAPKLARLVVDGPDSPLRSLVQGALDNTRAGAQSQLDRLAGQAGGGDLSGFTGGGSSAANIALGRKMAARFGWTGAQFQALVGLWNRESGWSQSAHNPSSGAHGIPQSLPASKMASEGADYMTNPATQIAWGLKYIQGRYGSPSAALSFHDANNWYRTGGLVEGLQKGGSPLKRSFNRAVNTLRGLNVKGKPFTRKQRSKALHGLLDKIKDVGLPGHLNKQIGDLTADAEIFGDMASRAGQLTVENEDGTSVLGVVDGKSEPDWLTKQLGALFELRNRIIRAEQIVVEKRDKISALIERAQKRHREVAEQIRQAGRRRAQLEREVEKGREQLEKLRKKPKQNRAKIDALRGTIMGKVAEMEGIGARQKGRVRERDALQNRILPALNAKRTGLNTARGDLLTSLTDVQGVGSPMERLGSLPPLGMLGGQIFDVQMRLRELATPKPVITDTDTGAVAGDDESAALLRELLREANLRTAVSEAQFKVFAGMPFMGAFAKGGIALVGEKGPELAHMPSGTRVHSAGETRSMLAPTLDVKVVVYEGEGRAEVYIDDRKLDAAVERVTRRQARHAGRGLPSAGGGG